MADILVVDDHAANLQLLVSALENQHTVRAAINGQLAIASAKQHPPDLMLLDVMMPQVTGYDVCRAFQADSRLQHIPIIFISGVSDQIDLDDAQQLGVVGYLTKPIYLKDLVAMVNRHLGS